VDANTVGKDANSETNNWLLDVDAAAKNLNDDQSELSPNQISFLRNVSGGTENGNDGDYETDEYDNYDDDDFDADTNGNSHGPASVPVRGSGRTPPKHPNAGVGRINYQQHNNNPFLATSLSRDLSVGSAVGSEIQEDIPEELTAEDYSNIGSNGVGKGGAPKKSLSPPLVADSPLIQGKDRRKVGSKDRRGESSSNLGGNGMLPPPPPSSIIHVGGTNAVKSPPPHSNPSLNHRSPSVEDTYSSDEDHVEEGEDDYVKIDKGVIPETLFKGMGGIEEEEDNNNMVESVNSSSGGSVGKQLVKSALERPHPRGATVSRRERVRKGRWKQGNKIGNGSFGTVFMGMNQSSGTLMAIKSMPLFNADAKDVMDLQSEIDIMRKLSHPNIVRYFGAELNEEEGVLNIFQEWVPGGSIATLLNKMGAFSIPVVRSYLRQVLLGLEYLHGHRIIHRDIKGGNILVDNYGTVKLADFGASKKMNEEGTLNGMGMSLKGTPYFMAPEVLSHEKYGRKADMWSTGGVALQMATGEPPWKSLGLRTPVSLFFHIQTSEEPPPLSEKIEANPKLKNIILRCFARDPNDRPRATELLKDPFFAEEEDDDDSETTFSDANDDYRYYEGDSDDGAGESEVRQESNAAKANVPPPSPSSRKTPKTQHKNKTIGSGRGGFTEDGYKQVGRFDVKTAKERADLKSGKGGPNSPHMYADLGINDLLPESDEGFRELKTEKNHNRPKTTAVNAKKKPAEQPKQRPQTTLKTKQLERQESMYHTTEEIPAEWPSWARQKTAPAPPPQEFKSPASVYGTPREEAIAAGQNPFGNNARKQPPPPAAANPFGNKDLPTGRKKTFVPKPSRDSPTKFMKGPTVEQFKFDNSPKAIRETRVRAKTASTIRENYSSGESNNPDSPNAKTEVTRSHGSGEKVIAAAAAAAASGERWKCFKCGYSNALDIQYCENCATWRRVDGGKGDGREVITVSGAWSSMQKSQEFDNGEGNSATIVTAAERHQAGRIRRAKSVGATNDLSHSREAHRDHGGSKSAAAGRNFRKKWGKA